MLGVEIVVIRISVVILIVYKVQLMKRYKWICTGMVTYHDVHNSQNAEASRCR